eukprot:m.418715 g.418715  ORF g.418715 m.418715 type:complete len:85 (+) comp31090_c0_seq1:107-361(+)
MEDAVTTFEIQTTVQRIRTAIPACSVTSHPTVNRRDSTFHTFARLLWWHQGALGPSCLPCCDHLRDVDTIVHPGGSQHSVGHTG